MDRYRRSAEPPATSNTRRATVVSSYPSPNYAAVGSEYRCSAEAVAGISSNIVITFPNTNAGGSLTSSPMLFNTTAGASSSRGMGSQSAVVTIFSGPEWTQPRVINREWGQSYDKWLLANFSQLEKEPVYRRYIRPNLDRGSSVFSIFLKLASALMNAYYRALNPLQHCLFAYFMLTAVVALFIASEMAGSKPLAAFSVPGHKNGWDLKQKASSCRKAALYNLLMCALVVLAPFLLQRFREGSALTNRYLLSGIRTRVLKQLKSALKPTKRQPTSATTNNSSSAASTTSNNGTVAIAISSVPQPSSVSNLTNRTSAASSAARGATPTNPMMFSLPPPPQFPQAPTLRRGGGQGDESLSSTFGGLVAPVVTGAVGGSGVSVASGLRDYLGMHSKKGSDDDLHDMV